MRCSIFVREYMFGRVRELEREREENAPVFDFFDFFFEIFGSDSRRVKYMFYLPFIRQERSKGIWGHNWCVAKQHLIDINGFDEDYVTAGVGEDVDIEWRLLAKGLRLYSIRFAAIQFHLHHKENYNNVDVETGKKQLAAKIQIGSIVCKNGLNKI